MPDIKAPAKTLIALGSERRVVLNRIGKPAVLLFLARETADDGPPINARLRESYPLATDLMTASVVDLHIVPRLVRSIAEAAMRHAYEKAVQRFPREFKLPQPDMVVDPEDYILILPDWDGSVTRAFGMRNPAKTPGVAVLDTQGQLVGIQQGGDLAEAALGFLEQLGSGNRVFD